MNDQEHVRVVLVDDEDLVRMGLRLVLGADAAVEVVAEAADGRQALTAVRSTHPDVVLMDIRMPVLDGLSALRELRGASGDGPAVIMLTTFDTDELVVESLRLGASGFLLKNTAPADLLVAVRAVAAGRPMVSPSVLTQLMSAVASRPARAVVRDARARLDTLTDREREVADAIARGLSNADIATELYMGVGTVKTHVGHLFDKLGVENRVQVALLVRDAAG